MRLLPVGCAPMGVACAWATAAAALAVRRVQKVAATSHRARGWQRRRRRSRLYGRELRWRRGRARGSRLSDRVRVVGCSHRGPEGRLRLDWLPRPLRSHSLALLVA